MNMRNSSEIALSVQQGELYVCNTHVLCPPSLDSISSALESTPRPDISSPEQGTRIYVFDDLGISICVNCHHCRVIWILVDFERPDWTPFVRGESKKLFEGTLLIDGRRVRRGLRFTTVDELITSKSGLIGVMVIGNEIYVQGVLIDFDAFIQ